jgi:SAM-dependent methyltransferase
VTPIGDFRMRPARVDFFSGASHPGAPLFQLSYPLFIPKSSGLAALSARRSFLSKPPGSSRIASNNCKASVPLRRESVCISGVNVVTDPGVIFQESAKEAIELACQDWTGHRLPKSVNTVISPNDGMRGYARDYFRVGSGALAGIQSFANLWRLNSFSSIMDFGCGHGRVLRWLKAAYSDATVVGTDIDEDGVQFCAENFGSVPLQSFVELDRIKPGQDFDLIFAGSVVTHLPEPAAHALLSKFVDWLRPGGIAVFSVHGPTVVSNQLSGNDYTVGGDVAPALSGYFGRGFGFADYHPSLGHPKGYGVSFTKPDWFPRSLENNERVSLVSIIQRGWAQHHDLVAFCKR